MDELRRQIAALTERWQRFPFSQRLAMFAVIIASVIGFSFVMGRSTGSDWQSVCDGREFANQELTAIQTAWRQQGLKNFRKDGSQLSVPKSELSRYEAALPKSKVDEAASGSEWEKQLSRANLFSSYEQLEQLKDNALRNELRRQLKKIPAISDADVIWARSKGKSAFSSRPKVTATVNVTPREGHDVTSELAQSLRSAVASMVADLNPQDIVILDQSTGLAITDHNDPAFVQQQHRRQLARLAQQLESRISAGLTHIPGAIVKLTPSETSHEVAHFTAKPVLETRDATDHVTDSNRDSQASRVQTALWNNDLPQDVVSFASFDHLAPTVLAVSYPKTDASTAVNWRVTLSVPQSYFEARDAQNLVQKTTAANFTTETWLEHLRTDIARLLPMNTAIAEFVVERHETPTSASVSPPAPFTAWPHAICITVALLLIATLARPLRQASPAQVTSTRQTTMPTALVILDHSPVEQPRTASTIEPHNVPHAEPVRVQTANSTNRLLTTSVTNAPTQIVTSTVKTDSISDDLARLQQADTRRLIDAMQHEHPQAIAVLLTRFSNRLASETLAGLAPTMQLEVVRRLKSLGEIRDDVVLEIARSVIARMDLESNATTRPSKSPVNRIVNALKASTEQRAFA